jgi:ATP-dependent exoDNAse (exonuclease V) alpha subunit
MTADPDLQRLLAAIDTAGAKAVLVGDPHQLGAVGPGGALGAVLTRHPHAVIRLDENLRQADPHERRALAHLRDGDTRLAVRWYRRHERIHTAPDRLEALTGAVTAWAADIDAGQDSQLLAWRRRDVADLNRHARAHWRASGRLHGPDLHGADGRRYAAGDLVVLTTPDHQHNLVTSERAVVTAIDETNGLLLLRVASGRVVPHDPRQGLDHAYATTVHRAQGATVDTTHVVADGGGRELAYVAMSRARHHSDIHIVADDLDQAVEQLADDWSIERRQRWIIDGPAQEPPTIERHPQPPTVAERLDALARRREPPHRGISLGR